MSAHRIKSFYFPKHLPMFGWQIYATYGHTDFKMHLHSSYTHETYPMICIKKNKNTSNFKE